MSAAPADLAAYRAARAEPPASGSVLADIEATRAGYRAEWPDGQPSDIDIARDERFAELIESEREDPTTLANCGGLFGEVHDRLVRIEARLATIERRGRL